MSNYKNFIQDFPDRCGQILEEYKNQAIMSGLEVTHMFAIAAAALPIPFERLRKPSGGVKHPSGDKEKYEKAAGKFCNLCDKEFVQSDLLKGNVGSWKIGEVEAAHVSKGPQNWALCSKPLPSDIKVVEILEHIRNALAHGSIFTLPDSEDQIENIIFLSKIMAGNKFAGVYKYLALTTDDFYNFLVQWINFLRKDLKLPD